MHKVRDLIHILPYIKGGVDNIGIFRYTNGNKMITVGKVFHSVTGIGHMIRICYLSV